VRVVISRLALSDIVEIGSYIRSDDPVAAEAMMDLLEARCTDLSVLPHRSGVVFPGPPPVRRTTVGSYNIYYTVRSDHVRVERIYHGRRDIGPELFR
jgi:toxin ParE1/3/4